MENVVFWGKGMPGNMMAKALKTNPTDKHMSRSSSLHDSLAVHLACSHDFVSLKKIKFVVNSSGICSEDESGKEAEVCLEVEMDKLLDHFVTRFRGE